jgi:hypothetical protein
MFKSQPVFVLLCLVLVACSSATQPPGSTPTPIATPAAGVLSVDPSLDLGSISPYLLGSNYGPWIAVPVEMLPAAYASGVKAIRFPGGAWGDRNNLKPYHIDPFIAFCQQVGAIPTISVRLREGTPQAAADLVHYVNVEKGYGVLYWSIGNEPTLFAAELRTLGKADDYDTAQFNVEWRKLANAMKEVDPTIKLLGPEIHQFNYDDSYNPKDSAGRDWMTEFLKANGDLVDVVTFHRYPFPRSSDQPSVTIGDLRQHTLEWEKTVAYLRGLIQQITGRDIPIAVTEVNTHYNKAAGGEATPDSHYNAIWLAETLGQLMRQDILMVNHWMLTSHGSYGGWGLIGRGELRPSYYVYQLYSKFGTEQVYADSGVGDASVYAAKRDDGALTLMIVNLADSEKQATLQVQGETPSQAELWRLDLEHLPEAASAFSLPADGGLNLPPQSVSLFIFNP